MASISRDKAKKILKDGRNGLSVALAGNRDAFIRARIKPTQEAFSKERGRLQRGKGKRG